MNKTAILCVILLMMFFSGCASKEFVLQKIEPLEDRISKIEAMDCCNKAEDAAKRAEDAANRAEISAKQAEIESEKAAKAFELLQMK